MSQPLPWLTQNLGVHLRVFALPAPLLLPCHRPFSHSSPYVFSHPLGLPRLLFIGLPPRLSRSRPSERTDALLCVSVRGRCRRDRGWKFEGDENVAAFGELCGSGAGGAARTWVWSQRIGSVCRAAPAQSPGSRGLQVSQNRALSA